MAAIGIPWFTGHPEEVEAANIRAQRQLAALGAVTAPVGRLLGAMRQQQQDQAKADLANERLGATLGIQADKADAQSAPMGGGMSTDTMGAGASIAAGPGTDPTAITPAPQPTQPPQKGFLSRFASGLKDVGMRALSAAGAETGIGAPYTPEFMQTAKSVAQREGQVERQKLANARLEAMQGMHFKDPGTAAYRGTGGAVDLRGLETYPPVMDPYTGNALYMRDAMGDPIAHHIIGAKRQEQIDLRTPEARKFTYGSEKVAHDAILAAMKRMDENRGYTDSQLESMIDQPAIDRYIQQHPEIKTLQEKLQRGINEGNQKTFGTTTTPSSDGTMTPSTDNTTSPMYDEDGNLLGYSDGQP